MGKFFALIISILENVFLLTKIKQENTLQGGGTGRGMSAWKGKQLWYAFHLQFFPTWIKFPAGNQLIISKYRQRFQISEKDLEKSGKKEVGFLCDAGKTP